MKKQILLFVTLSIFSSLAFSQVFTFTYTNLNQGQKAEVTFFHNAECIQTVQSLTSGSHNAAVWLSVNDGTKTSVELVGVSPTPAFGTMFLKFGGC